MDALALLALCLAAPTDAPAAHLTLDRGGDVLVDAAQERRGSGGVREWRFRLSADGRVEMAPVPAGFQEVSFSLDAQTAADLLTTLEERRRLQDRSASLEDSIAELDQVATWLLLRSDRPLWISANLYPHLCEPERRRRLGLSVLEPPWCRDFAGSRLPSP